MQDAIDLSCCPDCGVWFLNLSQDGSRCVSCQTLYEETIIITFLEMSNNRRTA